MISVYYSGSRSEPGKMVSGITAYTHEIILVGGYRSASFSFNSNSTLSEEWFYNGVGRHISVYSIGGNKVWEGIVNSVLFNIGPRALKIVPLINMSNRINVGFQYPNYNIPGDTNAGLYDETGWGDNWESQTRYGVLEELISGGSGELISMQSLRDNNLVDLAEPRLSESLSSSSESSGTSISVECIGYTRLLEKQIYNRPYESGLDDEDLSEKINSILGENLFFVGNKVLKKDIQSVGLDVSPVEGNNRTAWGIITDHISKGSVPNSIKCGIFNDMSFQLSVVEESGAYWRKFGSMEIFDETQNKIRNSELVPGKIMTMLDFSAPIQYRINSVKYDAINDSISINFHDSSLRVVLSKMMLGGFSS